MVVFRADAGRSDIGPPHPHFVSLDPNQVFAQENRPAFSSLLGSYDPASDRPEPGTHG